MGYINDSYEENGIERQEMIKKIVKLLDEVNDKYLRRVYLSLMMAEGDEKKRK